MHCIKRVTSTPTGINWSTTIAFWSVSHPKKLIHVPPLFQCVDQHSTMLFQKGYETFHLTYSINLSVIPSEQWMKVQSALSANPANTFGGIAGFGPLGSVTW